MIIQNKRFSRHRGRLGDVREPPAARVVWVKFACFLFIWTEPFVVLPSSRGKSHVARFHAHLPRRKPLLVPDVEATGNFSYTCDRSHGANYLLLGDAYAFIDPVFSSGVLLAMNSAFVGAEAVDICLRQPDKAAMALRHFVQAMKHGPKKFSWFIYRATNPTMRNLFMSPRNCFQGRESVLAGDIFGKTPIWRSLLTFKAIYYLTSLASLKCTITAWKRRKLNIRPLEEAEEAGCR